MIKKPQAADQPTSADQSGHQLPGASAIDSLLEGREHDALPDEPETASAELELLRQKARERDEFLDLLQRTKADFANYQKRVLKEMESERRFAAQPLMLDLLSGLDNLERALQAKDAAEQGGKLLEGVRLVHQQLLAALARHGVQPIAAQGKPFDPSFHEALLEQPSADKPPRTVLAELQKGYSLHDRVIRPTKVIVSSASVPSAAPPALESAEKPQE